MIAVVSAATAIAIIIASTIMNTALGDRITHPPTTLPKFDVANSVGNKDARGR